MNEKMKTRKVIPAKPKSFQKLHPSKVKSKYLSTHNRGERDGSSRNHHPTSSCSVNYKQASSKVEWTDGDSQEWNLNIEAIDKWEKISQYSMKIPEGNTKENDLFPKSDKNSFVLKSESGWTSIKFNEKLDYSNRGLVSLIKKDLSNKLKHIRLSYNRLSKFPEEIWDLIFLKSLYVDNNQIENLPSKIGKLTKLRVLDIHNNSISEIPSEIGNWVSLKKISLKENKFTSIPFSLGKLENLWVFEIEWFKYWLPPIRISDKKGKIRPESMQPCINKFKELWKMFEDYGPITLSVFLRYFSTDANSKKGEEPDFNKQDNRKRTILHRAATAGHIGVVKGLLSINSIDPNKLEKDQWTPLGLALRDDHEEIAHILIEKEKVDVNLGGGSFYSFPIHIAVSKNKYQTISKLIKRKVDVNKVDFKLQTPLHIIMDVFSK